MAELRSVELSVLGRLVVVVDGEDVTSAIPAQLQPLLVALALADEPVDKRRLARDVLYLSPATVDSRLSRLGRALGLDGPLHRASPPRSGNIELDRSLTNVDADEYRLRIASAARTAHDPRAALAELLRADDLWLGAPVGAEKLGDREAMTAVGRGRRKILDARERALTMAARLAVRHGLTIEEDRLAGWSGERPDLADVWFARVVMTYDALGARAARHVLEQWDTNSPHTDATTGLRSWIPHLLDSEPPRRTRRLTPRTSAATVPIGREGQGASLDAVLQSVTSGAARLVVIHGPPGAGKSRLIAYAHDRACVFGMRVVATDVEEQFGLADALRSALGPVWADALRDPEPSPALRRRAAALSALLGPGSADSIDGPTREPVDPIAHAADLAVELLGFGTRDEPLLLILDNVHRAEPALGRLVGTLQAARVPGLGIIASSRDPFLASLGPDDEVSHLFLGDLDHEDAHRFVAATRGRLLAPDALAALTDRVGATPLALLTADLDGFPAGISSANDAMRATLRGRNAVTRRAVAVAAVATHGTLCDMPLVEVLGGNVDLSAALSAEADRDEILQVTADGLAFSHRVWQEVAYGALDPSERRRLHGLAVRHLDERIAHTDEPGDLRSLALRLSEHARRCDLSTVDRVRAAQTLTRAADLLQPVDAAHAIDLYGQAIAAVTESTLAISLHLQRGRLRWQSADWAGAQQDLAQACALADSVGDLKTRAEALLMTAHVTWEPAHADELGENLARLLDLLVHDERLLRARVEACLAGGLYQDGSTGTARNAPAHAQSALAALAALSTPPDPEIEAELLWWARKGLLDIQTPEASAELSARMQEVAGRSEHHLGNALLAGVVDNLVLGRTQHARMLSDQFTQLAAATGAPLQRYAAATLAGVWALYEGRFDDLVLATGEAQQHGTFGGITATQVIEGQRVCVARDRGEFRGRRDLVDLVEALTPVDGPIPIWSTAGAWLKADAGDITGATERLSAIRSMTGELAEIPRGPHRLPLLAFVAETLAELRWQSGGTASASLTQLAERAATELGAHPAAGVLLGWPVAYLGSKQRYLGLAAAAAGRLSDAVEHLREARRLDGARTPLGARNALALARLAIDLGPRDEAERLARVCLRRATELGMEGVADDARRLISFESEAT